MLINSQHNSFTDPNLPTKSMIDASMIPLTTSEVKDIVIIEDGDENVYENTQVTPQEEQIDEDGSDHDPNQDDDFEVVAVEAVDDDDILPDDHKIV